jgi:aminomethyltransferase
MMTPSLALRAENGNNIAMTDLLRTPLYDWHVAHGGRMVEFGGWEMPVQYTGIVDEHHAVRKAAGLFDISHMGRLRFTGSQACALLDHIVTNDVSKLQLGQVRYALVCNEAGGVLDDVLVYRLPDCYWLVVNASNRLKIVDWIQSHLGSFQTTMQDLTRETAMIAVQGPQSLAALTAQEAAAWKTLKYYGVLTDAAAVGPEVRLLSRTGYTGEDGCELIVPADQAVAVWDRLLSLGVAVGARPCGLGCRDTLRLEAAMPLYGHELNESIDPLTAGLQFAVKLDKPDFLGKAALVEIAKRTDRPVRVGLQLAGRRIAREGAAVFIGDNRIGEVTSGTFSPTLDKAIAMAYVSPNSSSIGTSVEVDIRGKRESATIVKLPFYQRAK